jgi:hypothetical protein
MIYQRVEKTKRKWYDVIGPVMLIYDNTMIHSSIKMTPNEARKPANELSVKLNLQLNRTKMRKYPNISVGDSVKLYRKKNKLDKESLEIAKFCIESFPNSGFAWSVIYRSQLVSQEERDIAKKKILEINPYAKF